VPQRLRRLSFPALAAILVAPTLAGCGTGVTPVDNPPVHGDTMTMTIDGGSTSVTESGRIVFSLGHTPEISFTGQLGCEGGFFTGSYSSHIDWHFRYSSEDAYLLIGNADLLHFPDPPEREGGNLVWRGDFGGRDAEMTVECAHPPEGPAPLSELG